TIIDDSYISDFQSIKIALDFLEQQKQHSKKSVIFSDILQSGENENELYKKIAELFRQNNISKIIGIGKSISEHKTFFDSIEVYQTTDEFLSTYNSSDFSTETILVKGA